MKQEALDQLIESWGSMGVLWGINRSMARVHALLLASEEPLRLDDITGRLGISRGNASMCLKELRSWQVVKRVHLAGDRRDYYLAESDMWRMFFRIATERKKREFDPALQAVRSALAGTEQELGAEVRQRLVEMESILGSVDRVAHRLLADEQLSRTMFKFLTTKMPWEDA